MVAYPGDREVALVYTEELVETSTGTTIVAYTGDR
jgi:hypothetical protein